ncbi:hypothetical protein Q0V21_25165 [Paenibacillus sp. 11B]|uniref:hypothetical protein n=1 Tax=unclassified Paenibacillus TaxID=185978 RepID=UPI002650AA63|nr:hypothetical protein [Paenibacillus sp. 11B]MDN8592041.1 hypothetical protein [Paenibacillus sp. 11B]
MKRIDKDTLLLEAHDLYDINVRINESGPDYYNQLVIHAVHLHGAVFSLDGMKIVADEPTKERYGDLFERLEDALNRHNS